MSGKEMDKKPFIGIYICISILLVFIGISIMIATAQETEKSNPASKDSWLYVGGSGPGNYTRIQDAINGASNGDFIFVFAGIYYENILIYKSLHLIGENAEATIIDGQDIREVVKITADSVSIERFTIRNSTLDLYYITAGILIESNFTTISNNIIVDNSEYGIFFRQVSYNRIYNNTISETYEGIFFTQSNNNTITNNTIHNSFSGIYLGDSSNNQILANTLHHNEYGIKAYNVTLNYLQDNTILSNDDIGINLMRSYQNTIRNNTILYNRNIAISLGFSFCNSNIISDNNIQGNALGIEIIWGKNNKIYRNNFLGNQVHAGFSINAPCRFLKIFVKNYWMNNYWDDHHTFLPRLISGTLSYPPDPSTPWYQVKIKWIAVDWHPAQKPNNIPAMT